LFKEKGSWYEEQSRRVRREKKDKKQKEKETVTKM